MPLLQYDTHMSIIIRGWHSVNDDIREYLSSPVAMRTVEYHHTYGAAVDDIYSLLSL